MGGERGEIKSITIRVKEKQKDILGKWRIGKREKKMEKKLYKHVWSYLTTWDATLNISYTPLLDNQIKLN